jgi:U3 small nucleolar RNA-associated protein MPP10
MELQDTQSQKSLAQIYEDEYQTAATGGKAVDPRDVKLKKDHEEIENLWSDICYKLDALSSLNFVPKQVSLLVLIQSIRSQLTA